MFLYQFPINGKGILDFVIQEQAVPQLVLGIARITLFPVNGPQLFVFLRALVVLTLPILAISQKFLGLGGKGTGWINVEKLFQWKAGLLKLRFAESQDIALKIKGLFRGRAGR